MQAQGDHAASTTIPAGSVPSFAGNAQHTATYQPTVPSLNRIRWSATIDFNNSGSAAHYGAPLITAANTVLAPVKIAGDAFRVDAFDGVTGTAKYSLAICRPTAGSPFIIHVSRPAPLALVSITPVPVALFTTSTIRIPPRTVLRSRRFFTLLSPITSGTPPPITQPSSSTRRSRPTAKARVLMFASFPADWLNRVVIRGIGSSLASSGVSNALPNPALELRDSNGFLLASNNDGQDDPVQAAKLIAAGLAPSNNLEAGLAVTLPPGRYTALLAGENDVTGIGLVEVYDLGP